MLELYIILAAAFAVLDICFGESIWMLVPLFIAFFVALILIHFIITAILTLFVDKEKVYRDKASFWWFWLSQSCRIVYTFCGMFVKFRNTDKLEKGQKYLFVGNHVSNLDPMIVIYMIRKFRTVFISKIENFKIPIGGKYMKRCGFMAIDRESPRNALRTIMEAADIITNDDMSVCIYPEGTRNKTAEKLLEFHNGVFKIAQRAKVPVAVFVTKGLRYGGKAPKRVSVEIIDVIPAERVCAMKTNEIGEYVREKMMAVL